MIHYRKCYYCERKFGQQCGHETKDHVIPQSRGGRSLENNIVICCAECNVSKGNLLLSEWESRLNLSPYKLMNPNPEWRERIHIILANIRKHHLYVQPYKDVGKHDF